MSTLNINLKSSSNSSLVDKILEQGQRLRNSMVQAVLNNDPLNKEIVNSYYNNVPSNSKYKSTNVNTKCSCEDNRNSASTRKSQHSDQLRVHKYLRGDEMCVNEELKALETLRCMSPASLIHSTSCVNHSCHSKIKCAICKEYENRLLPASISSSSTDDRSIISDKFDSNRENYIHKHKSSGKRSEPVVNYEKYGLNRENYSYKYGFGEKQHKNEAHELSSQSQVYHNNTHHKHKKGSDNPQATTSKYADPNLAQNTTVKDGSKLKLVRDTFHENQHLLKYVDSLKITVYSLKLNSAGNRKVMALDNIIKPYLSSTNTYFVEYTVPDILVKHLPKSRAKVNTGLNPDKTVRFCSKKLQNDSVYFKQQSVHQISNINLLDLSSIKISYKINFRSVKQRNALLIGKANVNLGSLITNRYLTSDQDLVITSENAPVVLGHLKVSLQFGCDKLYFGKEFIDAISCSKENASLSENDSIHKVLDSEQISTKKRLRNDNVLVTTNQNVSVNKPPVDPPVVGKKSDGSVAKNTLKYSVDEPHLLYALIHVSEVRLLLKPVNSYLICRGFCRDDTLCSKVIYNDCSPVFNFYQTIPILLDEGFVNRLRDNYIIVEVWEKKNEVDGLIGLSKLSLHQLYIAYRNPEIVRHLARNQHPVIGVDWWEPITNPISNSETGQLRGLVSLGTQTQIETLELNRGLRQLADQIPPRPTFVDNAVERHEFNSSNLVPLQVPNSSKQIRPVLNPDPPGKLNENAVSLRAAKTFGRENTDGSRITKAVLVTDRPNELDLKPGKTVLLVDDSSRNGIKTAEADKSDKGATTEIWEAILEVDENSDSSRTAETVLIVDNPKGRANNCGLNTKPLSEFSKEPNKPNESTGSSRTSKTILVSDKYVQEPEIETPSLLTLNRITEVVQDSKVDASTQSEVPEMEAKSTENPASVNNTQRDFLNSFLEHLLSARDLNQRNRHVENSTNTESRYMVDNSTNGARQNAPTENVATQIESPQIQPSLTGTSTNNTIRNTSDLLDSLHKALSVSSTNNHSKVSNGNITTCGDEDSFKAHIVVESALHLPSRKKCKSKRNKLKNVKNSEEILPSSYVTFKGKANEYLVTPVVAKSTSPRWDFRCDTRLPAELLFNNQKRLIFKVWRKASGPSLQPNFQTDIVLGFAALDLTVFLSGLPTIQGWFNIKDFSSKCNGQIKIHLTPLENLSRFIESKQSPIPEKLLPDSVRKSVQEPTREAINLKPQTEVSARESEPEDVPSELLSRALKRKFTELDEITQRLRQRLSAVTNDDSDGSNDDFVEEFERDLNTECVETDEENVVDLLDTPQLFNRENLLFNRALSGDLHLVGPPKGDTFSPLKSDLFSSEASHLLDQPHTSLDPLKSGSSSNLLDCFKSSGARRAESFSQVGLNEIDSDLLLQLSGGQSTASESSSVGSSDLRTVQENKKYQEKESDSKLTQLDSHLAEGKMKIDSLLEKLSLLTSDNDNNQTRSERSFSSRYVSGCSINQDPELVNNNLLKQMGLDSEKNVDPDLIFNPLLFQQMFTVSMDSTPRLDEDSLNSPESLSRVECTTLKSLVNESSSSSSIDLRNSDVNLTRPTPDGAGNSSTD